MALASHPHRSPEDERVLDEVRKVVVRALDGRRGRVYLIGSWISGARRKASDIDIAVEMRAPLPSAVLARLRDALEESHVPQRVDVVDLAEVDASFRERALLEGQLWIELAND
jgi:predicted nucleotidyltransferase